MFEPAASGSPPAVGAQDDYAPAAAPAADVTPELSPVPDDDELSDERPGKELTRRLSNGVAQAGRPGAIAVASGPPSRDIEDIRGSSLDQASFRKSSSASMLKASASGSSSSQGRSSYAGFRRGNQRDSRQQLDPSSISGGLSRLLHLSEDYPSRHHGASGGGDDAVSEVAGSSAGAAALAARPARKSASAAAFFPSGGGGSSGPGLTVAATAGDDASSHHDLSPSGTISKAWRNSAAVQAAAGGRLSSLLPVPYKEKDKMERLQAKLEEWSPSGIPEMPTLYSMNQRKFDPHILEMEDHWTSFIPPAGLTGKQKDQQEALWELLNTEVEYIKSIKYVVVELFMACLFNLQVDQLLNDVAAEKMFGNVSDLGDLNIELWETDLLKVLNHSRQTHELLNPRLLKPAFSRFSERFHGYTKYCLEQPLCSEYLKKMEKENEAFRTFVAWAEAQKQCNRLKLHDLLVKPMQRITRYSLLLNAILKKTDDPEARHDLGEMIANVDTFVRYVDQTLRLKHEEEKLRDMSSRIESYDAVDMPYNDVEASRLLGGCSTFNVLRPMPGCGSQLRHLLYEGPLKMKEAGPKSDVICFLFTDMFLITKAKRADKVKVIKAPLKIDRCLVDEFGKDSNAYFLIILLNEFDVAQAAYAFHGENIPKWVKLIRKAQGLYETARLNAQQQAPVHHAPLSAVAGLQIEGDDDIGFVGPDPPPAGSEACVEDDGEASVGCMGRGGASVAAAVSLLPDSAAAESGDFGSDSAAMVGTNRLGASHLYYGADTSANDDDEEEVDAVAEDASYRGTRAFGSAAVVAAGAATAAAVTRSASSPVMSARRPNASVQQHDRPDTYYSDGKASHRRGGGRFLTADAIQPFSGEASEELSDPRLTFRSDISDRMNGEVRSEPMGADGSELFPAGASQSLSLQAAAERAAIVGATTDGRGGVLSIVQPPRAMPRKHVPPPAAINRQWMTGSRSSSGEAMILGAAAPVGRLGTPQELPLLAEGGLATPAAAALGPRDQHEEEGCMGDTPMPEAIPNAGPRTSSRKLSHAELMRMRAQMFTSSPFDGAQV